MYVEKFKTLMDAIVENNKGDQQEIDYLTNFTYERAGKFVIYFNRVYDDVLGSQMDRALFAGGALSQEDLQTRTMKRDSDRRSAHDMAISACEQINRFCKVNGVPNICPETTDRYEVAEFIGRFVQDVYQEGIRDKSLEKDLACKTGHSLDDAFAYANAKKESYKTSAADVKEKMETKWKEELR